MELLKNHIAGQWVAGDGPGTPLLDPVQGEALVAVSSQGLDLAAAFAFARQAGGGALRALSYGQQIGRAHV